MYRLGVSLLAHSPLGFGLLTGKYDGLSPAGARRLAIFESMKQQRWGRASRARPRAATTLARAHGLTPTRMALAWVFTQVADGEHDHRRDLGRQQLDENLDAWDDARARTARGDRPIRWEIRDPAQ